MDFMLKNWKQNPAGVFILVGSLVGVSHALAESFIIGLCGLKPGVSFILNESLLYLISGSVLGACLWLFAKLTSYFGGFAGGEKSKHPVTGWRLLPVVLLGYSLLGLAYSLSVVLLRGSFSGGGSFWAALVIFALGIAAVVRANSGKRLTFGKALVLVLTVSFLVCGTNAYLVFAPEVISQKGEFYFPLVVFAPFLLGITVISSTKGSLSSKKETYLKRERPLLGAAVIVIFLFQLVLWSTVFPWRAPWCIYRSFEQGEQAAAGAWPNILLVILDSVRADILDLFADSPEIMPFLARFVNLMFIHVIRQIHPEVCRDAPLSRLPPIREEP